MTKNDSLKDVQEHEEYLEAKDGTQVFMRSWLPKGEIEHVVFAVHGQCVHSATFRKWASAFGERKIATFGIDLRGYGNTGMRGDAKDFYLVTEAQSKTKSLSLKISLALPTVIANNTTTIILCQ